MRYNRPVSLRGGMQQIQGCSYYWGVPLPEVNNMPYLSSNKEKTCVALALTSTEDDINKMARGNYQVMLQSMQLLYPLFFVHL